MSETKEVNQSPEQETQSLSELLQIRRDKLSELQAQGKDPFAITTAEQTIHAADIAARFEELENTDCAIAGRMMTRRDMGKANFITRKKSGFCPSRFCRCRRSSTGLRTPTPGTASGIWT